MGRCRVGAGLDQTRQCSDTLLTLRAFTKPATRSASSRTVSSQKEKDMPLRGSSLTAPTMTSCS